MNSIEVFYVVQVFFCDYNFEIEGNDDYLYDLFVYEDYFMTYYNYVIVVIISLVVYDIRLVLVG